ncbi:MAG: hypothetical protein ABIR66_05105, partial [Saprospiraceae bacterium]
SLYKTHGKSEDFVLMSPDKVTEFQLIHCTKELTVVNKFRLQSVSFFIDLDDFNQKDKKINPGL